MSLERQGRIEVLDALRGFALFGILLAHISHWFAAGPLPPEHVLVAVGSNAGSGTLPDITLTEFINRGFITGRFYPLFTSIFGVSFYLQTISFSKNDNNATVLFLRRALVLLIIGFLHQLLWMGDILMVYALLMMPLVLIRNWHNRLLLVIGMLLVMDIPGTLIEFHQVSNGTRVNDEENQVAFKFLHVISAGNWKELLHFNLFILVGKLKFQAVTGRLFFTMGFFMLGMQAGRKKWLQKLQSNVKAVWAFTIGAFIVLIALQYAVSQMNIAETTYNKREILIGNTLEFLQSLFAVIMYSSFVILLSEYRVFDRLFQAFSKLGRMALTAYVMQTLIGLLLFYPIGFGLFHKTTQVQNIAIGVVIYAIQLVLASVWFNYFNYGILEWVLRSGTYLKLQPLVKKKKENDTNTGKAGVE
ncbi:MAG: DUF418 domain-containing protein [Chitinophagia bacterium]|nr:DUF418 domain-containing protein [Chitinophagia bacterium]